MESALLSYERCKAVSVPFYCEENACNILRLAMQRGVDAEDLFAVFISNPGRYVPFHAQKPAHGENTGVCYWDYHVIPVIISTHPTKKIAFVYDVDSLLPFPTTLQNYVTQSIRRSLPNGIRYQQLEEYGFGHRFRVVSYTILLQQFSTNRIHMQVPPCLWQEAGIPEYKSVPPPWPCFKATAHSHPHSLPLFLKMDIALRDDVFALDDELGKMDAPGELCRSADDLLRWFRDRCRN